MQVSTTSRASARDAALVPGAVRGRWATVGPGEPRRSLLYPFLTSGHVNFEAQRETTWRMKENTCVIYWTLGANVSRARFVAREAAHVFDPSHSCMEAQTRLLERLFGLLLLEGLLPRGVAIRARNQHSDCGRGGKGVVPAGRRGVSGL